VYSNVRPGMQVPAPTSGLNPFFFYELQRSFPRRAPPLSGGPEASPSQLPRQRDLLYPEVLSEAAFPLPLSLTLPLSLSLSRDPPPPLPTRGQNVVRPPGERPQGGPVHVRTALALPPAPKQCFARFWLPAPSRCYRCTSSKRKRLPPLESLQDPRHRPTVVSQGGAISFERGGPVDPSTLQRC
jgi:hypothetical protein